MSDLFKYSNTRLLNYFLLSGLLLLYTGCVAPLRTIPYFPEQTTPPPTSKTRSAAAPRCNDWKGYVPDTLHPEYQPMRYLRVNVHIMNSRDSSHNFQPAEARVFFTRLLAAANASLDTNMRNWRSPEGTAVLPKGYRYQLTPQPGDDGFYFHYDDSLYWFVS